jgi:hypothetical protein
MLRLFLKKFQLSKLRRDVSSVEPSKSRFRQLFQGFTIGFKESTATIFDIVGIISGIGIASAAFSYVFEKFEAHRKYSLVLEGKLLAQEKVSEEKLLAQQKVTEEKLRSQEKVTEEKLRAQQEKLLSQEEKLRAQQKITFSRKNYGRKITSSSITDGRKITSSGKSCTSSREAV